MNIRDLIPEIILVILMAASGIIIVSRLWQDAIISISVLILVLCFGAMILQLIIRVRKLEEQSAHRERAMRSNLEDLGRQLIAKQDATSMRINEAVESIKMRMYR
ncbi:MAG TPA: hypothetical protein O0W90_00685 [Methanocorpusculum sp.]|nr:hypothetical protein [Methanocorpusculum sp.]